MCPQTVRRPIVAEEPVYNVMAWVIDAIEVSAARAAATARR